MLLRTILSPLSGRLSAMSLRVILGDSVKFSALALGALPAGVLADGAPVTTGPGGTGGTGAATLAGPAGAVTAARLRPAVMARNAAQSVLLGAATAGKRVVAVGERGIILLSDDAGKTGDRPWFRSASR